MGRTRGSSDGILVDTFHYRFKGLELDSGTLSVDGVDPADIGIQLDDEIPPEPAPHAGKVVDKIVPLELRMHKTFDRDESGSNRTVKRVTFSLTCANPTARVTGTDIELLRSSIWDFLDKQFAVKWTQYYLVRIEPSHLYMSGPSNGLGFSYDRIERGVAHDGSLLMRQWSRGSRGGFEVKAWPGEFKDSHGKLMACIPATDANGQALEEFMKMITQLRERLAAFFRPETIEMTLANLGGLMNQLSDGSAEHHT